MKRKIRKAVSGGVVAILLLGAQSVIADNIPMNRQITLVQTYANFAAVRFDPPYENNLGCAFSGSDSFVVIDWTTNANNKAMYAATLSAYLTQQPVGFGISGCSAFYGGGTPLVYRVDIPQ